jgi:putative endonuclease
MKIFSRAVYTILARNERKRARALKGRPPWKLSGGNNDHLETGRHGETLVYWYLRQNGYTMVARNRQGSGGAGELDLVGWDGPVLAFIEVKTRTTEEAGPPEASLQASQQERIVRAAQRYIKRLKIAPASFRFDIASVSWHPERGYGVRVIKNAFGP